MSVCGTCVNAENPPLGLLVGEGELNLPVDTPGADEGGVQRLDPVRRHYHLHHTINIEIFPSVNPDSGPNVNPHYCLLFN